MSSRAIVRLAGILGCCALITWLLTFKIMDYDVWWHIKAGQLIRQLWALPALDPFAYTREGLPYLATHEWLAQIFLSLIYDAGGATGLILFRVLSVIVTLGLLLSIDRKRIWPNAILAVLAAEMARPGFLTRPQMFTFLLLALTVRLAVWYLDEERPRIRSKIMMAIVALQLPWVNVHGAASMLGIAVAAALGAQRLWDAWLRSRLHDRDDRREIGILLLAGLAMLLLLFASPNGSGNIAYLWQLTHDKTVMFIKEWQPRPWGAYLRETAVWWALASITIIRARRAPVFASLLVLAFGALSVQAFRHEMPFIIVMLGVIVFELRHDAGWHRVLAWLAGRRVRAFIASIVVLAVLFFFVRSSVVTFTQRYQLQGFGAFAPARGAADFLEREHLQDRIFNSYDIGGYLLFRRAPEQKVFIDGRNVDFGFALMNRVTEAAQDPAEWRSLEDEYGFTVAVIHFEPYSDIHPMPYVGHLGRDPRWSLVFADDWTAVYVRNTPEHAELIARLQYHELTPEALSLQVLPETLTLDQAQILERELRRSAEENPESIDAPLLLGRLYRRAGLLEEAGLAVAEAVKRSPGSYRPYELRALLAMDAQRWSAAASAFDAMLLRSRGVAEQVRSDVLADVYEKAGRPIRAAWERFIGRLP